MTSTPYYNEYQFILNSDYLTSAEKVKALEKLKEIIDSQLKDQLVSYLVKKWSGGLLELVSSAIPIGGAGKAGASIGTNLLKKTLGRKLSQEIGSGAVSGIASGAVFGAGQGLIEDKNPLELAIQYGASGLLIGGLTGGVAGKIIQDKSIKYVNELVDKRKDWGIAYRKASGNPELAIQTLLENKRGFVPDAFNKKGIGNVDLVWGAEGEKGYGLAHLIEKRSKQNIDIDKFLNELPETIKKGIVTKNNPRHPNNSYIEDINNKIAIVPEWEGKNRNWVVTAFKQNKSAAKRLMSSSPLSNISPKEGIHSTSGLAANSFIISHLNEIFNLTKKDTINKGTINQGLPSKEEGASINSASKYLNIAGKKPESQSLPSSIITDFEKTFNPTFKLLPAWLSSLFLSNSSTSPDILQENMPLNIPVLKGGVQMDVNLEDLTNLINPEISKNTKIEDFPNHQYEMDEKTGIPVDYESGCFNGGTVYVNSYTRDDGTEVRGYYRSRPNRM